MASETPTTLLQGAGLKMPYKTTSAKNPNTKLDVRESKAVVLEKNRLKAASPRLNVRTMAFGKKNPNQLSGRKTIKVNNNPTVRILLGFRK
jgi:hypothetical protein